MLELYNKNIVTIYVVNADILETYEKIINKNKMCNLISRGKLSYK
jgi:hypothetical protein